MGKFQVSRREEIIDTERRKTFSLGMTSYEVYIKLGEEKKFLILHGNRFSKSKEKLVARFIFKPWKRVCGIDVNSKFFKGYFLLKKFTFHPKSILFYKFFGDFSGIRSKRELRSKIAHDRVIGNFD